MNRVQGGSDAEQLQIRSAGDPFLGQQDPNKRLGTDGQASHKRQDQVSTHAYGLSRHFTDPFLLALHRGERREEHAVDCGVDIAGDHGRQLRTLVVVRQIRGGIAIANNNLTNIRDQCAQKCRSEDLPTVRKGCLQTRKGKQFLRPPTGRDPKNTGVDHEVCQMLCDDGPDSKAEVGHDDADDGGDDGSSQCREEEKTELQRFGNICVLDILKTGDDDRDTENSQGSGQRCIAIGRGDQRCAEKQHHIQEQTEADIKVENGRKICIICVFLLYQGSGEATVNKDGQQAGKNRHDRNGSIVVGCEQTCQDEADYERYSLRTAAFCKAPEKSGYDLAATGRSVTHEFLLKSLLIRFFTIRPKPFSLIAFL